jgi:uncharacterized protein (TIGR03435 family)
MNRYAESYLRRGSSAIAATAALLVAGLFACAYATPPGANGQQTLPTASDDKTPTFEVVTIKPARPDATGHGWHGSLDRITIRNYTLKRLIRAAYSLKSDSQILGGPEWIGKLAFDIDAKVDDAEVANIRNLSSREHHKLQLLMLQSLLADRFQLKVTTGERTIPVYALVVSKSGAKLTPSPPPAQEQSASDGSTGRAKPERPHNMNVNNGHMTASGYSMDGLADDLTLEGDVDRVVVNRTGLTGEYDFKMTWTEDEGNGVPSDAPYPGLLTALKEQLGLELKPDKAPVEVVIVEGAEKPLVD